MKVCKVCGRSDVEFAKNSRRADGLQSQCKGCKKNTDSKHYQANKEKQYERVKNRRRTIRQYLFDYLKTHPCIDCGETDPAALEFDHVGKKTMNISDMAERGLALEKVIEEIANCVVRCSSCHAKKTAKDFSWYKDLV